MLFSAVVPAMFVVMSRLPVMVSGGLVTRCGGVMVLA